MPTLTELLTVPDVDTIVDGEILPEARKRGLTVTAWAPLDPWHILTYIVGTLRRSVRSSIAWRTAAGFGEYVFGNATPPGGLDVTSWAPLRAKSWYGVKWIDATYTKRRITLTNTLLVGYGPLAQGKMILKFPSGNRYIQDDDAVTIPASNVDIGYGLGVAKVVFRSEYPINTAKGYSYADGSSATPIQLINAAFPGVTATNPAPTYSDVAQVGYGLGTLTLGGAPGAAHSVAVRIDSTGESGVATWSTSLDGAAYVSQGAAAAVANLGGSGINITLTNGPSGPSFIAGSIYYFSNPGSDVTQVGRDAETPQQLGARCYAVWTALGFALDTSGNWIPFAPVYSAVEAFTRTASSQVAVCLVRTDGTVNNKVKILVAGQGALLPAGVLALLQNFWNVFSGGTDYYVVAAPSTQAITLSNATVTARAQQLATAKAEAQRRVRNYLTGVDPANRLTIGDGTTVKVNHSYLVSLIRSTPGVTNFTDLTLQINGAAADYLVPADALPTFAQDVATALTWAVGS